MSKKRKRNSRRSNRTASPATVRATAAAPRRRSAQEFNPDYTYIKTDLKRIGTLSASFLAILIVLAFVLH